MDFCRNVSVSGGLPSDYPPEPVISQASSKLDEFFPGENKENDVGLEWLSLFLEDCFSSTANPISQCIPIPIPNQTPPPPPTKPKSPKCPSSTLHRLVIPAKARTKRRRPTTATAPTTPFSGGAHSHVRGHPLRMIPSDPPLLHQAYWLAESELLVPNKKKVEGEEENTGISSGISSDGSSGSSLGQGRRCTHCMSQRTPQWRAGPLGPKTLCNACGVRFKSGRLLPEYRPAKSPTFVSYKHSNSHKKVMEMRMSM
ncbi:GATA transcription factor 2-like [Magnolia sinica]|uniref:GATA transcription factor 2-like n=1 Tax=Magnolia sinica TaxID=86752 RepID=UPI00265830DF|nr:GATA transcription factor 2-like [Magnolia sinica]